MALKLFVVVMLAQPLVAVHHFQVSDDQQGEYYEYDLQGSHGDQVKRKLGSHSKHVITAPFKIVGKCFNNTRQALAATINFTKLFLRDTHGLDGESSAFKKAMKDFEGNAEVGDFYAHDHRPADLSNCMYGLPLALWRIFKATLYTAGYRFPRATWYGMKLIFRGGCSCIGL